MKMLQVLRMQEKKKKTGRDKEMLSGATPMVSAIPESVSQCHDGTVAHFYWRYLI